MTRRRWIADEVHGNKAILTGDHAAHLARVLRAQVGQEFEIATGDAARSASITAISADRIEFDLGAELKSNQPASLTLILAIFKFDRMEWAIEKCTEIGVSRIVPLIARRTDSHLAAAAAKRRDRWERIARQASEQARRSAAPEIASPTRLKELIAASATSPSSATAAGPASKIVLAESGAQMRLHDILTPASPHTNSHVMLAIGPEGGWADDERNLFRQSGWLAASLGETILRVETAAIVATALALDALR